MDVILAQNTYRSQIGKYLVFLLKGTIEKVEGQTFDPFMKLSRTVCGILYKTTLKLRVTLQKVNKEKNR